MTLVGGGCVGVCNKFVDGRCIVRILGLVAGSMAIARGGAEVWWFWWVGGVFGLSFSTADARGGV